MGSHSANAIFGTTRGEGSYYCLGEKNGEFIHLIVMADENIEKLSAIIHEINECEITNLIREKILGDINPYAKIKITRKNIKILKSKFPESFTPAIIGDWFWVSHTVSPYGKEYCLMPRKKYRVRW